MQLEEEIIARLVEQGRTVAVAESCTGGLVGHRLTQVPGSSTAFLGGVIAYHNAVKERVLGVPADVLEREGAVSEATALAMAEGARRLLGAAEPPDRPGPQGDVVQGRPVARGVVVQDVLAGEPEGD